MKCKNCHRQLSDPESIAREYGPVCWITIQAPTPTGDPSQLALEFDPSPKKPSLLFTPEMSVAEQYRIVKRILNRKDV